MKYIERVVLALFLLTWCCAAPTRHAKHPFRPQVAPASPVTPCLQPICVVPS